MFLVDNEFIAGPSRGASWQLDRFHIRVFFSVFRSHKVDTSVHLFDVLLAIRVWLDECRHGNGLYGTDPSIVSKID